MVGKSVALEVLKFTAHSNEVSCTEQNIQILALRALEGDTQTKASPFKYQVERAAEVVRLDAGNNNNSPCLPCSYSGTMITTA